MDVVGGGLLDLRNLARGPSVAKTSRCSTR